MNTSSKLIEFDEYYPVYGKATVVVVDEKVSNIEKMLDLYTKLWDVFYTLYYNENLSLYLNGKTVDFKSRMYVIKCFDEISSPLKFYRVLLQNVPCEFNDIPEQNISTNTFNILVALQLTYQVIIDTVTKNYKLSKKDMIHMNMRYNHFLYKIKMCDTKL